MTDHHSEYYLENDNRFVIENYSKKSPFASFLPGIAGLMGIPMWVFYVNRGQGICSFGIGDKDKPIMEFHPAYRAYQQVELTGFRTFINIIDEDGTKYYEPFSAFDHCKKAESKMLIGLNELAIEESNLEYGIKTNVEYFTLPNEDLAALVRKVTIQNISSSSTIIEVLDGMPAILPYGINNDGIKQIGNTLKAWMEVYNLEKDIPYYKLRAGTEDKEDIDAIAEGHFYLSFVDDEKKQLLKPIVDSALVFGSNTAMSYAEEFAEQGLGGLLVMQQVASNKVPCGFFGTAKALKPNDTVELYSVIGHISSMEALNNKANQLVCKQYMEEKQKEARALARELTEDIATKTSSKTFDEYCRQTYLDNLLRGGYPILIKGRDKEQVYYVYSRKHGDLERDYNYFVTEPEFYSSGNGNYRDMNQNRCNDVFFHPEVEDVNIKTFMSLIQADGYNPLVILGERLALEDGAAARLLEHVGEGSHGRLQRLFAKPFTLGRLYKAIMDEKTVLKLARKEFVDLVIKESKLFTDAEYKEGFWADHWVYNLDLIEKYLAIYPEKKAETLLYKKEYTYYDNAAVVNCRADKYRLKNGRIIQLEAVEISKEKERLISERDVLPHFMRTQYGKGEIYQSSLLAKLLVLAVNKFSCLDPMGIGVEMEAGKPGWNDAMNGLPGMFGSSVAESCELLRLMDFIAKLCEEYQNERVELPIEAFDLLDKIVSGIEQFGTFGYWDSIASAREEYRSSTQYGFSGEEMGLYLKELLAKMRMLHEKLARNIEASRAAHDGIYPTYYYYQPTEYRLLNEEKGTVQLDAFVQHAMPLFLEGVVKGLKVCSGKSEAKQLYQKVKQSRLFDGKLQMYKVCEPLSELSIDFGRITAFTPGWFENETVWLHMEYKYMLELLNCGLYDEFFSDFRNVMIPFLSPEQYGRSTLENSSFIASSANPDQAIHGKGFVARLSGATAEFLSIWNVMMAGHKPFRVVDDRLYMELKPILPHWLFDEKNEIGFRFLDKVDVTYYNPSRVNTYGESAQINTIQIAYGDGREVTLHESAIAEPYSQDIRSGKVEKLRIEYR